MAGQEPGYIAGLFAGLVPGDVIAAYEKLLAAGGVAREDAERVLGGASLVEELSARGRPHALPPPPSAPATFQPASPELALLGVLADLQATLSREQKSLLDVHRRLAHVPPRPGAALLGLPLHLIQL